MLGTSLVVLILQVICATADASADRYYVHQISGPYNLSVHVPSEFKNLKINGQEYQRLSNGVCRHEGTPVVDLACGYDPLTETATVNIRDTRSIAWVSFEMYPFSSILRGYVTVFFTQDATWQKVDDMACILPQYSSPGFIYAKDLTHVTVKCARKKICHHNDNTLIMLIGGTKKCEKNAAAPNVPCTNAMDYEDLDVYALEVLKPTTPLTNGKTYVYCETTVTEMSFIIDWNAKDPNTDPNRIDQPGGKYDLSMPVPMAFEKLQINDKEYQRLPNGVCQHMPVAGGNVVETDCNYDSANKMASVRIGNTRGIAWVGFEMYSSAAQKGYQTAYFTQLGSWANVRRAGCILPQYSSPSFIYANDQTTVTIKCARKKICNHNDNTLIMSIEGTKKCEKDAMDPDVSCTSEDLAGTNYDTYELEVSKPTKTPTDGNTYVYCGTKYSQLSFVIKWVVSPCKTSLLVAYPSMECRIPGMSWIYDPQTHKCMKYPSQLSIASPYCYLMAIQNIEASHNSFQSEMACKSTCLASW